MTRAWRSPRPRSRRALALPLLRGGALGVAQNGVLWHRVFFGSPSTAASDPRAAPDGAASTGPRRRTMRRRGPSRSRRGVAGEQRAFAARAGCGAEHRGPDRGAPDALELVDVRGRSRRWGTGTSCSPPRPRRARVRPRGASRGVGEAVGLIAVRTPARSRGTRPVPGSAHPGGVVGRESDERVVAGSSRRPRRRPVTDVDAVDAALREGSRHARDR